MTRMIYDGIRSVLWGASILFSWLMLFVVTPIVAFFLYCNPDLALFVCWLIPAAIAFSIWETA